MATTCTQQRHLTDRDVEVLLALDRCPLTVAQLLKLSQTFSGQPFTSIRSVQDRLQKLRDIGWVKNWPYVMAGRGSAPDYYKPTLLGYHLLYGEHAVPPTKRHFAEVSVANHHHTCCLAEFIVHILVAAKRSGVRLINFYRENTLRLQFANEALCPDCAFDVRWSEVRQYNFLVELDNGTERIRSDKDTDSWQRKIRLYHILQARTLPKRFRVLVVTTRSQGRLDSIRTLVAEQSGNSPRSLFYFAHLADCLAVPDLLVKPCFRDHRNTPVVLLADGHLVPMPQEAW